MVAKIGLFCYKAVLWIILTVIVISGVYVLFSGAESSVRLAQFLICVASFMFVCFMFFAIELFIRACNDIKEIRNDIEGFILETREYKGTADYIKKKARE